MVFVCHQLNWERVNEFTWFFKCWARPGMRRACVLKHWWKPAGNREKMGYTILIFSKGFWHGVLQSLMFVNTMFYMKNKPTQQWCQWTLCLYTLVMCVLIVLFERSAQTQYFIVLLCICFALLLFYNTYLLNLLGGLIPWNRWSK